MSLAVSYTTHTVEITASGLAVAAIGNSVEVSAYNHVVQVSPLVYQVSVAQAGVPGPTGPGVPLGGTTGQVMVKLSDADLDTGWGSVGGGDMLKSTYDTDGDGKVNAAVSADAVPWSGVTGKPSTYAPSAHKTSHATGGTDVITPADIGAATASHNHDGVYSSVGHNHDLAYSPLGHDHSGVYAPASHTHSEYSLTTHDHAGVYSPVTHDHDLDYADISHTHDGVYSPVGHDHSGVYAPATHSHDDLYYTESEVDARFNTSTGHDHDGTDSKKIEWANINDKPSTYAPSTHGNAAHSETYITASGVTYENLNANGDVGTGASQVAAGNHGHAISDVTNLQTTLDGKAATTHNHDTAYSPLGHDHSGVYAPASHTHSEYSLTTHNHDGVYSPVGHDHSGVYAPASHNHAISDVTNLQTALDGKASTTHNHDSAYAAASHNHDTVYLSKTNTTEYTPTANYHPTTKKYVDDLVSSSGGGDMLKSVYDLDNDGKVDAAEAADSVPWSGVTDKPSTYTPSAHKTSHATGGTDALSPADIGAATASHDHSGVYSPVGHDHSGVYAPVSHSHAISDVTNLQTTLDGKASTTHNHDSAYASITHTHTSLGSLQLTSQAYYDEEVNVTGTTFDLSAGNHQKKTMSANITVSITVPSGPAAGFIRIIGHATNTYTIGWPSSSPKVVWLTTAMTSITAGKSTIIAWKYDGTNLWLSCPGLVTTP